MLYNKEVKMDNEIVIVPKKRKKNTEVSVSKTNTDKVVDVFEFLASCVIDDLETLNSKERVDLFVKILPYIVPKAVNKEANEELLSKKSLINCVIENAGIMIDNKKIDK